jgi:hypothetical protein
MYLLKTKVMNSFCLSLSKAKMVASAAFPRHCYVFAIEFVERFCRDVAWQRLYTHLPGISLPDACMAWGLVVWGRFFLFGSQSQRRCGRQGGYRRKSGISRAFANGRYGATAVSVPALPAASGHLQGRAGVVSTVKGGLWNQNSLDPAEREVRWRAEFIPPASFLILAE